MSKKVLKKDFLLLNLIIFILFILTTGLSQAGEQKDSIIIFAAGSTINAVSDIAELFSKQQGIKTVPSFASSSTLARQIDNGAPAHVYISANKKWMDYLEKDNMIEPKTRFNLLSNSIVLIAPKNSKLKNINIKKNFPLASLLGSGRMAMGDPEHVPSGIYGKQAMKNLGVWDSVKDKIVPSKDVRAALVLVERGEVPLGQVYSTDAAISPDKVKIISYFPADSHTPIVYPAAIVAGHANTGSMKFLEFLKSSEAKQIFEKYGFNVQK